LPIPLDELDLSPFFIATEMRKMTEIRESEDLKKARKKKTQRFGENAQGLRALL